MSAKVIHTQEFGRAIRPRPRTYTTPEAILDALRERMFSCKMTQKQIATEANISESTVNNIMTGKTRWPRPTTLFPIMAVLRGHFTLHFED